MLNEQGGIGENTKNSLSTQGGIIHFRLKKICQSFAGTQIYVTVF